MANRIIVVARRGHFLRLQELAEGLGFRGRVDLVSDERLVELRGGLWWQNVRFNPSKDVERIIEAANEDLGKIRLRCRYLRGLAFVDAAELISAAMHQWTSLLNFRRPSVVLSVPVDSYVLDTLRLCCEFLGVPFLAVVGSPFPGRIRFTDWKGSLLGNRPVSEAAAEGELQRLGKHGGSFKPDWLIGFDRPAGTIIRRRALIDAVKPLGNLIYRFTARDSQSYSFPSKADLYRRMFATPARAASALRWERSAANAGPLPQEYIFLPLQFYPECGTDYWTQGPLAGAYHPVTLQMVRSLTKICPIVVKEHPAAIGRRSSRFLYELLSIPGVHPVPVQTPVSELWPNAAATVGNGSTTMLQVLAGGGAAVFLGSAPFYGQGTGTVSQTCEGDELRHALTSACNAAEGEPHGRDNLATVRRYLEATAEGSLGGYRPIGERPHLATTSDVMISSALRKHFDLALQEQIPDDSGKFAR